jgi:hypothetical protein
VDDGARTHDGRIHNPGLYQLSYVHHMSHAAMQGLARPAGLEPATLGLAYHYCFRSPRSPRGLGSGLSLHRRRCRTYSLYGAPPTEQVSTGLPSAQPVKVSPLRCGPLQGFISPLKAPNRRPMLYPLELRALNRPRALLHLPMPAPPRPGNGRRRPCWSGQRDSNPRPSAPKADALPGCAMPRWISTRTRTHLREPASYRQTAA